MDVLNSGGTDPQPEPEGEDDGPQWVAYPEVSADSVAFVLVDVSHAQREHWPELPVLLVASLTLVEPGEHGAGEGHDAERLEALEEELIERAEGELDALCVGHIRGGGQWRVVFYGKTDAGFEELVRRVAAEHGRPVFEVTAQVEPEWTFYAEVLCPDAERWQWVHNFAVVQRLSESGDALDRPRRVDHWLYFASAEARERFIAAVRELGFSVEEPDLEAQGARPFGVQVYREDRVDIESIHAVVMDLIERANTLGGDYDGWETVVVKEAEG